MCWRVIVGVPEASVDEALAGVPAELSAGRTRTSAARPRGRDVTLLEVIERDKCGCELVGGHGPDEAKLAKARAGYERKGWSAAKIERALRDRAHKRQDKPASRALSAWLTSLAARDEVCVACFWYGDDDELTDDVTELRPDQLEHGLVSDLQNKWLAIRVTTRRERPRS